MLLEKKLMGNNIKNLKPDPHSKYKQGYYKNAQKYVGPQPIIYRSSLEYRFIVQLELSQNVDKWSSENIQIPYTMREFVKATNPETGVVKNKFVDVRHTYNIDFTVWLKNGSKYIVEIKPSALTPLNEEQIRRNPVMYKNACKWNAAIAWCKMNGYIFRVITENHLKSSVF